MATMNESALEKDQTPVNQLVDHLFRHESGKLVSVLTKILGTDNIELAEDVVQDALAEAIDQWTYKGIPENPTGWLYTVAKYKAINFVNREKHKRKYKSEVVHLLQYDWTAEPTINHLFSAQEIEDDQLRMMFTCCHSSITSDSQVALILKTLCGFSVSEIAHAFLTNDDSIAKRLVRARQIIRENRVTFDVPVGGDLETRLDSVLETLYLLFSEGYNASAGVDVIRQELCEEAIRLTKLIVDSNLIKQKHSVYALLALMLLNASRFSARQNSEGNIIDLANQDRGRWNREMIQSGIFYLSQSVTTNYVSRYQIMAAISAHHCAAEDDASTDWKGILLLYNNLSELDHSPIVLLNRAVAVSKVFGVQQAIDELEKLSDNSSLANYSHYYSTLAELYLILQKPREALPLFEKAKTMARNEKEVEHLQARIMLCNT